MCSRDVIGGSDLLSPEDGKVGDRGAASQSVFWPSLFQLTRSETTGLDSTYGALVAGFDSFFDQPGRAVQW
jgi:hypothetical protein